MKTITLLFVLLFLMIISLPLVFMDTKSEISKAENRRLAPFPLLFEDGKMNELGKLTKALDDYINDRFGFRNTAVSVAKTAVKQNKIINNNVVIGKNGWLFYVNPNDGNSLYDFLKINLYSDAEMQAFIMKMEKRKEWCDNNNIKFLFFIAPNKHNVYPEYYPINRPSGITRTGQIMAVLPDSLKDTVIYPLDHILLKKSNDMLLYYENDTHWNAAGAYYAFETLFASIKEKFPETAFPEIDFITEMSYDDFRGDLAQMASLTAKRAAIPSVRPINGWESFYQYVKNEGVNGVITKNVSQTLPRVIVYRDSFFSWLEPFTSSIFSSAEYNWIPFTESVKDYILSNKPDLIIWEICERYLSFAPHWEWK